MAGDDVIDVYHVYPALHPEESPSTRSLDDHCPTDLVEVTWTNHHAGIDDHDLHSAIGELERFQFGFSLGVTIRESFRRQVESVFFRE